MSFDVVKTFKTGSGADGTFYSLPALAESGIAPNLSRLPVSIRIVLESVLRNCDGKKVTEADVTNLANYNARSPGDYEIPFTVSRIVLQDFTGVPLLVDLAAMRSAVDRMGKNANMIEPLVPVDLVVDHSVQVDYSGFEGALEKNLAIEFIRNRERYEFLKWGQQAFDTCSVVPPGIGIVHQVNLEYLAKGVLSDKQGVHYFDTLVGTDSHTTMINGLGVVGWGVGGIEAEAGMLGQPVTFLVPEVVGVNLTGQLAEGVTATDLTLRITEVLRQHGVVGKFVEFHGEGARALSLPDRATIANMAPEYGATMGFFPVDEETVNYLRGTGRSEELCQTVENYFRAQGLFGIPAAGEVEYTDLLEVNLNDIVPSVAGPKRPQDRIDVPALRDSFNELFTRDVAAGGFGREAAQRDTAVEIELEHPAGFVFNEMLGESEPAAVVTPTQVRHGSVLIAAITSCTNTSNPSVMLAAGLLARKANEKGLTVAPYVKTSLGPGSRVVTDYLEATGLQDELDQLGFQTVGYGCTTCIGNSGPLNPEIESAIAEGDLVCASVLSGNRNFEARVHQNVRANFLMSPPLVVAYALAGRVDIDLTTEPIGNDSEGNPVFLTDVWPTQDEVREVVSAALKPEVFNRLYGDFDAQNPQWNEIASSTGDVYTWNPDSTYIQEPPFFDDFSLEPRDIEEVRGARPLGVFGDSVTTDHISPAGAIKEDSPAGRYLVENGVEKAKFNSYGSRRGNDRIMTRGTFANVRIKNLMVPGSEGGVTKFYDGSHDGEVMDIYDAAQRYKESNTPLIVVGAGDYGMGSSRDWAAKGTRLLGVRAVVTKSFERIHRSNLIGMGVLPLNFSNPDDYDRLALDGSETFDIIGLSNELKPRDEVTLVVHRADGTSDEAKVIVRLDTPVEIDYYRAGGILPYVLAQIISGS